jgi:hypothetical protein
VAQVRLHLAESIEGKMWPLLLFFDRSWHPPVKEIVPNKLIPKLKPTPPRRSLR